MLPSTILQQRRWRYRMLLLHGSMMVAPLALLLAHTQLHLTIWSGCVFKALFQIEGPACGITRSVSAVWHCRFIEAFKYHPAGPAILLLVVILAGYFALVSLTRCRGLNWPREIRVYQGIEYMAVGLLVLGWLAKILLIH